MFRLFKVKRFISVLIVSCVLFFGCKKKIVGPDEWDYDLWVEDADLDGKPDSLAKYSPECLEKIYICVDEAQDEKKNQQKSEGDLEMPQVHPKGGTFSEKIEVKLTSSNKNCKIRYTKDGEVPDSKSSIYEAPFFLDSNTIVMAAVFCEIDEQSKVVTEEYQFIYSALESVPLFVPEPGVYNHNVACAIYSPLKNVVIRYTITGDEPNHQSEVYQGFLPILETTVIKARYFFSDSSMGMVQSAKYELKVEAPVFSVQGGEFETPQHNVLKTNTPGALITYTRDGSTPTLESQRYISKPILIEKTEKISIRAFRQNWTASETVTQFFKISSKVQCVTPIIVPKGGIYEKAQVLSIISVPGAKIYYTLNNSEPTIASQLYTKPIYINRNTEVKAKIFKENLIPCETIVETYLFQTDSPKITPASGELVQNGKVVITGDESGEIRYTLNGSVPDTTSAIYSYPIELKESSIVKARIFKNGLLPSKVTVAHLKVIPVNLPGIVSINPEPGMYDMGQQITMKHPSKRYSIYYSLDGSIPTETSRLY